jgi:7-cyano-7-deazaguanine synthase
MGSYEELAKKYGGQPTVVPNRNMNFIAQLITVAWVNKCNTVMLGVHATDAGENHYPDCKETFIGAMNAAAEIGTEGRVSIWAPFARSSKGDIVREAASLKVPAHLTMSCYNGQEPACGRCATCHERLIAFRDAGYVDPIKYAEGTDRIDLEGDGLFYALADGWLLG